MTKFQIGRLDPFIFSLTLFWDGKFSFLSLCAASQCRWSRLFTTSCQVIFALLYLFFVFMVHVLKSIYSNLSSRLFPIPPCCCCSQCTLWVLFPHFYCLFLIVSNSLLVVPITLKLSHFSHTLSMVFLSFVSRTTFQLLQFTSSFVRKLSSIHCNLRD